LHLEENSKKDLYPPSPLLLGPRSLHIPSPNRRKPKRDIISYQPYISFFFSIASDLSRVSS
jgi:hypothetical protein